MRSEYPQDDMNDFEILIYENHAHYENYAYDEGIHIEKQYGTDTT